ncbi:UTRA domain-containing protein [Streptomyces guryensis]|uniref:UTRA domain-containing protein n=1 Tax=Streptomyces guryensis TaxID=2886947 RepID=A0A9Q3ZEJ2_9ACTN|nr:UTRA domain-containing protein [Streptomyces guryensis]MCD9879480.1 UTRA domain-containing protein [Streptomyces guryensis]
MDQPLGDEVLERPAHRSPRPGLSITVADATPETAKHLGCEPGRALLRVDRVHRTVAGRLVELAISHFLPEPHSYRGRLRRGGQWCRGRSGAARGHVLLCLTRAAGR